MLFTAMIVFAAISSDFQLRVRVYNEAAISGRDQEKAFKTAERIYAEAGIETKWFDCGVPPQRPARDQVCRESFGQLDIQIHIIPQQGSNQMARSAGECGRALLTADGFGGTYAYVYAKCLDATYGGLGGDANVPRSTLLGYLIAHELGHLLLGSNSHELAGIMARRWTVGDEHRALLGALLFHPWQARRMRKQVEALRRRLTDANRVAPVVLSEADTR